MTNFDGGNWERIRKCRKSIPLYPHFLSISSSFPHSLSISSSFPHFLSISSSFPHFLSISLSFPHSHLSISSLFPHSHISISSPFPHSHLSIHSPFPRSPEPRLQRVAQPCPLVQPQKKKNCNKKNRSASYCILTKLRKNGKNQDSVLLYIDDRRKVAKNRIVSSCALTEWGEQPLGGGGASQAIPHAMQPCASSDQQLNQKYRIWKYICFVFHTPWMPGSN